MFENILRELENLGRQPIQYKFPIEVDEDGYIDKECPNEECLFQFKIHNEDWKNICKDEAIYCPNVENQKLLINGLQQSKLKKEKDKQ